jgi:membrane-associated phospholipid phosphatase
MSSIASKRLPLYEVPQVITRTNKWKIGTVGVLLTALVYLIPNHMKLVEPTLLHMFWVDRAVPLLPWTIWIYISDYFMVLSALLLLREVENQNRFLYSYVIIQAVAVSFFVFYPTIYPRELHPLPQDGSINVMLFEFIRWVDHPSNCFPSLHVATCFISAFAFLFESRAKLFIYVGWAILICISTLTTKQHYVMDILGGFALASIASWISLFRLKIRV